LRRPANFALHSASFAVFSSLVFAFSATSAQDSKSTGVLRHHCASQRTGANTTRPPMVAIANEDAREAITDDTLQANSLGNFD
jgi:hypothetical protein